MATLWMWCFWQQFLLWKTLDCQKFPCEATKSLSKMTLHSKLTSTCIIFLCALLSILPQKLSSREPPLLMLIREKNASQQRVCQLWWIFLRTYAAWVLWAKWRSTPSKFWRARESHLTSQSKQQSGLDRPGKTRQAVPCLITKFQINKQTRQISALATLWKELTKKTSVLPSNS